MYNIISMLLKANTLSTHIHRGETNDDVKGCHYNEKLAYTLVKVGPFMTARWDISSA